MILQIFGVIDKYTYKPMKHHGKVTEIVVWDLEYNIKQLADADDTTIFMKNL